MAYKLVKSGIGGRGKFAFYLIHKAVGPGRPNLRDDVLRVRPGADHVAERPALVGVRGRLEISAGAHRDHRGAPGVGAGALLAAIVGS